jgi:hypothetical protein
VEKLTHVAELMRFSCKERLYSLPSAFYWSTVDCYAVSYGGCGKYSESATYRSIVYARSEQTYGLFKLSLLSINPMQLNCKYLQRRYTI